MNSIPCPYCKDPVPFEERVSTTVQKCGKCSNSFVLENKMKMISKAYRIITEEPLIATRTAQTSLPAIEPVEKQGRKNKYGVYYDLGTHAKIFYSNSYIVIPWTTLYNIVRSSEPFTEIRKHAPYLSHSAIYAIRKVVNLLKQGKIPIKETLKGYNPRTLAYGQEYQLFGYPDTKMVVSVFSVQYKCRDKVYAVDKDILKSLCVSNDPVQFSMLAKKAVGKKRGPAYNGLFRICNALSFEEVVFA